MDTAAEYGDIASIIQLHRDGQECTTNAIDLAAQNGHLEIVKFIYENDPKGCFGYEKPNIASDNLNDLEMAFFVYRKHLCTIGVIKLARSHSHWNIVHYLITHHHVNFKFEPKLELELHQGYNNYLYMQFRSFLLGKHPRVSTSSSPIYMLNDDVLWTISVHLAINLLPL